MARTIRNDLDGVVTAYEFSKDGNRIGSAYTLHPGDQVPDGVLVGEHALQPVVDDGQDGLGLGVFDPSQANVKEVNAYLDGATDAERRRVLVVEAAGHGRQGVLHGPYEDLAPDATEGDPGSDQQPARKAAAKKAASPSNPQE